MKRHFATLLLLTTVVCSNAQLKDPSFEEVISLRSVGNPEISVDGKTIAFTMRMADWEKNEFDTERLAANWHNWQWFNKYIWGEDIELPITETKDKK